MDYIEIEIGGKLRGWKINQMALEIWSKKTVDDAQMSSSNYAALWAGLKANCYAKEQELDFTFEDVCNWVDNLKDKKTLILVKKTFEESLVYTEAISRMKDLLRETTPVAKKKVKMK